MGVYAVGTVSGWCGGRCDARIDIQWVIFLLFFSVSSSMVSVYLVRITITQTKIDRIGVAVDGDKHVQRHTCVCDQRAMHYLLRFFIFPSHYHI